MKTRPLLVLLFAATIGLDALADASVAGSDAALLATVRQLAPEGQDFSLAETPVPGLHEVTIGLNVFYVSDDGQFLLGGPLISVPDQVNLTDRRVTEARVALLAGLDDLPLFRFPATEARHGITVFTDIDCPYCRKLHNEVPGFQAAGIDVNYVMLPRSGKDSPSYFKTVAAACASDPEGAITAAMNGTEPAPAKCAHAIDRHMALARQLGVSSTPTLLLEDGRLVVGLKSLQQVQAMLAE